MSEQAVLEKKGVYLASFEIEVSTHNSGDWLCLFFDEKFRGRWSAHKQGSRAASLTSDMLSMPDVPGMRMKVTPKNKTVEIYDPLESMADLLREMATVYQRASHIVRCEFKPMPRQTRTLNDDELVTFLWQLRRIADGVNPVFEVISGQLPTAKEIESLPGRELSSKGPYSKNKPKYKDDGDLQSVLVKALQDNSVLRDALKGLVQS